jgi:hypothetical protein
MFLERDFLFNIPDKDLHLHRIEGQGTKKMAIILSKSDLNDASETLCKNIMSAIKHDYQQDIYRIIVDPAIPMIVNDLGLPYQRLVVFGLKPKEIGLNIEYIPHFVLSMDAHSIIFTSGLSSMVSDQKLKTQLWTNLQQMLQI